MSAPAVTPLAVRQEYLATVRAIQRLEVIAAEQDCVLRVLQARRDTLRVQIEEYQL